MEWERRPWPESVRAALAASLRPVEALGWWPIGLRCAETVLLPKAGGDAGGPMQRRPITLLPLVYRLWAKLRVRDMEACRALWDPAVTCARFGAEGQAWELAWHAMLAGRADGIAGVAVDFRKCYDHIRLDQLRSR